jgi:acid stress chaperone HdeB
MKTHILLVLAAILSSASSLPATAQIRLNMNRVTCKDYLGYTPESRDFIRFWMSGYYNAAANSSVLNYNRLQSNSARVMDYCKAHKSATLPTAIQKVAQ